MFRNLLYILSLKKFYTINFTKAFYSILFHGTSSIRGRNIIRERKIRIDAPKVYNSNHLMRTSPNRIYLTPDFARALYYGNITAVFYDDDPYLIIFKVEISKDLLLPDKDEFEYTMKTFNPIEFNHKEELTLEESVEEVKSCAVDKDICFDNFVSYYVELPSSHYKNIGGTLYKEIQIILNNSNHRTRHKQADIFITEFVSKIKRKNLENNEKEK